MKAEKLIGLICHPENTKSDDLLELETLVNRYPYFQAARLLHLKALHNSSPARFRNELKSGSIYITDHKQFYKYLHNLLEFDYSCPVQQAPHQSLSDIVSDRIREINGYIPVNSVGIPARKDKTPVSEKREKEHIVQVDFPKPPAPAPVASVVPPQFMGPQDYPEGEIVSNPIFLDDMPGVVNDYSDYEETKTQKQQPVYETVEYRTHEDYRIEILSSPSELPKEQTEEKAENEPSFRAIELITEEDPVSTPVSYTPDEEVSLPPAEQTGKPRISLQELPDILGIYKLEDDSGYEEEPSVSELAASLRKKKNKKDKEKLIEKFITEEPSIPRGTLDEVDNRDLSEESSMEKEDLFSETLAKIYIKQQLYEKAIATYIKLSLKYPEKSVYFANRIEKIKAKINNNE